MKRLIILLAALALAGCSQIESLTSSTTATTVEGDAATLFPPTAENLAPSCAAATPTDVQKAACTIYKTNVVLCGLNFAAIGGVLEGAAFVVPGYGTAISAGIAVAQPVISADQSWWCAETGYAQKVGAASPTPAATPAPKS